MTSTAESPVAPLFAEEWGRLVAGLIRWCGDFDLAEESAQEAFAKAVEAWPRTGVPTNPAGWLTTVARNAARDRLRRRGVEAAKMALLITSPGPAAELDPIGDDRLRLIFTCCHPALAMPARVALTLRTLCGLSVDEIARAYLVTESTMDKRLVRARAKIRAAGIPYRVPAAEQLASRLEGVLQVLYLLFNEGYSATAGESLIRTDLSTEAIRLTRLLSDLMPGSQPPRELLALMLLTDARRAARTQGKEIVPLGEQDRSLWNPDQISEASRILSALDEPLGGYGVQALIASEHARAFSAQDTDWTRIAALYELLPATPIIELNRAVALAEVHGPAVALAILDDLASDLGDYHLFHAAYADLSSRAGDAAAAIVSVDRALELAHTGPERRFLARRASAYREALATYDRDTS